ncbi:MAG: hypothetical protein ACD_3C00067G0016 [uncultured bacterium (gcode 4)]|uniref:Uncharacterized protein n=1 Tax=uncultured bacterium (gcode 4) TaxID=1234023 RepID=K2G299_9BACT|nr:MAG: hypothetical protein ACD_3C00067G0016 [uncultured bacterium (gcode 4)]
MKVSTYNFQYDPKNLDMFKLDIFWGNLDLSLLTLAAVIAAVWLVFYYIGPFLKGYFIVSAEEKKKEDNKNKIKELIMMKEVQTELEKEIEESLLSAGLKTSTI